LPATEISPEQVAIANRGFRSLYNGLNLDQWQTSPATSKTLWKSKDWILAFAGDAGQSSKLISTEKFAGPSNFVIDVRPQDVTSSVTIHLGSSARVRLACTDGDLPLESASWNRIEGVFRDGTYALTVNGQPKSVEVPASDGGGIPMVEATGPVEFCNFYVGPVAGGQSPADRREN
jgi:hypothetical protein